MFFPPLLTVLCTNVDGISPARSIAGLLFPILSVDIVLLQVVFQVIFEVLLLAPLVSLPTWGKTMSKDRGIVYKNI